MKMSSIKMFPVLTALALAGGLSAWSPEAKAQWLVECLSGPGIPCASSADVSATTTQLTTTHTYLTTGQTGGPGGMIALLGGINERLGMVTNANDESVENSDLAARQRIYDERMMDVRGSRIAKPSSVQRACVQATAAAGRAGGARASGGASRAAGDAAQARYDDARPQIQALIDAGSQRKNLGTCSASDVEEKRPGCQGAAVGDRPGADLRAGSLVDGGKPVEQANASVDEKGFKIGQQVISNVAPLPADKLTSDEAKASQGGILYMLDYNRYNARATAATDALADILGFGVAMDVEGASMDMSGAEPFLRTWGSNRAEYEQIFGAGTFPEVPSERELIRFAVFKSYASVQEGQESAALTPEEVSKELLAVTAVSARVNYAILERLEKQNVLLAALLSHQMDPLTSGQMKERSAAVGGQRASDQD